MLGIRRMGAGQQYEIKWRGVQETTWEAASRVRKEIPQLVQEFEQRQQQQPPQQQEGATDDDAPMLVEAVVVAPTGLLSGASQQNGMSLQQVQALEQLVRDQAQQMREQAQQLQQLRASPAQSPQLSAYSSAAAVAAPTSRFAKKEPRAQDLREYDGASGAKLDAWLDELGAAVDLFRLNGGEAVDFAASRLRGAARQWWNALGTAGKSPLVDAAMLAAALRTRFQPVTSERVAREQLRSLKQGARNVNDYIADFQRLHTVLPDMSQNDALFAFESGLSAHLAEKLRVQGVTTLQEAIGLAARVGGLMQSAVGRNAAAHQMSVDDGENSASRLDRIEAALNALSSGAQGGSGVGMGAKTQTQRGYQQERNAGGRGSNRGGRGGRFGGGWPRGPPVVPGVSADTVKQRLDAQQCVRCGGNGHRSPACPNAISASGN